MAKQTALRFALGSPEVQYSHVWRVWVQGDEVYLAPRRMANLIKMSVHSSGRWRWAWTEESAIVLKRSGDRAQLKWRKPAPFLPGWVTGPSVMFPYAPVEGWEGDPPETTKDVIWLDPPSKNQKVTVTLLLADPEVEPYRDPAVDRRTPLHGELRLRSGGRLWVCSRRRRMEFEEALRTTEVQLQRRVDSNVIGHGGMAIVITESYGSPLFVEMRVPKR